MGLLMLTIISIFSTGIGNVYRLGKQLALYSKGMSSVTILQYVVHSVELEAVLQL